MLITAAGTVVAHTETANHRSVVIVLLHEYIILIISHFDTCFLMAQRYSARHGRRPVGQAWLRRELDLAVPAPAVESYVAPGARRTEIHGSRVREEYPLHYAPGDSLAGQLRFALRHESFDLRILAAAFKHTDAATLEDWVRREPTGAYSRRAWYLYETLTGRTLDLDDARSGNYVEALNSKKFIVAARHNSRRHRVIDNLLGGPDLCVTVRRTPKLLRQMAMRIDDEARSLCKALDRSLLTRAVDHLYTRETRSSFAIEGEKPSSRRAARFVRALGDAATFDALDKDALVRLQGSIVDPRYAATGWRDIQNFVGRTGAGFREEVHFVCPRPGDVPALMEGWMKLTGRVSNENVPPIVAAAVSAFAFVFVHPFDDGNGRIHRFLIHHILASRGYTPRDFIFPVSAAILRDRHGYDQVLESFSQPILEFVEWRWGLNGSLLVEGDAGDLYRFVDMTAFAEYLHERVAETVRHDLREELGFIAAFDRAFRAVSEIVDMPDRRTSLVIRLCAQNGGRLSARKRSGFRELSNSEVVAIESAIQGAFAAGPRELSVPIVDPPHAPRLESRS